MPPSYIDSIENAQIIIVDNTPGRNLRIVLPRVFYLPLYKNFGIAKALNVGFEKALDLGSEWVLTMDQDSLIPDNMLTEYSCMISEVPKDVAILAPQINMYKGESRHAEDTIKQLDKAITSGSLLRISTYSVVGGFKDDLFIDDVDFEYCCNVRKHGYTILQLNSIVMQHQLGETKEYKLFGKHMFYVMNEKPLRHYYMQRNQLYVRDMYKEFFPELNHNLWPSLISLFKVLLFEKNSVRKLYARYLGYTDYKNGVFGECKHRQLL